MASGLQALTRVSTGVAGLDTVLGGGLIERGLYIVKGLPGVGKTILANQIAFTRAAAGDGVVFFTLLAEPHDRMLAFLGSMSFADRSLLPDRLTFLSAYGALEDDGRAKLQAMGGHTIVPMSPAQVDVWRKAVAPVYDRWAETADKSGIDAKKALDDLRSELKKAGGAY